MTEYIVDEETNELKISKQKVSEKTIPPNVDIIKLIYQYHFNKDTNYDALTDEELEKEKSRLLSQLKEENNGGRKNTRKTKM